MVRDTHLTDPETSRDLFGVVRGRCTGCNACGRYLVYTEKYTIKGGNGNPIHPDCNTSLLDCSRCGCQAEAHVVNAAETARERGNDAMSISEFDQAIVFYTEAISHDAVDWRLYSNRSLCYAKKGWFEQALFDADRACSLNSNGTFKVHYRKATALFGLRKYDEGLAACEKARACLAGLGEKENEKAVRQLESEIKAKLRTLEKRNVEKNKRPEQQQGTQQPTQGQQEAKADILETLARLESAINVLVEGQRQQETRMERIEASLARILECALREQEETEDDAMDALDDANTAVVDTNDSEASYSSSDFSDAIADIHRAWMERLAVEDDGAPETASGEAQESEPSPSSSETLSSSVSSSGYVTRKSTCEDRERQMRIDASQKRIKQARDTGEVLMESDLDMLSQLRRGACTSCDECPGFKILYNATDVHDAEVMFHCSLCGCASEKHEIDTAFARQQAAEQEREDREARARAARVKSRGGEAVSKRNLAFETLGIARNSSKSEIRASFKRLAIRYHPDKASADNLAYNKDMFSKVREAYDLLMKEL